MSDLLAQLAKPKNLAVIGGAVALIAAGAFAKFAMGSGGQKELAAVEGGRVGFGQTTTKSNAGAPNVKSDYHPSNGPENGPAPKMTETKNDSTSVALNTKNPGNAGDNPLDVIAYGSAGAPVTIVEYGSFTCSHCATFHDEILPKLKERYIDKGQLRVVFRPFFRNALDVDAGLFVACLAPDRRPAWVSLLMHQQNQWVPFQETDVLQQRKKTREALAAYGSQAGISPPEFDRCMANEANKSWLQAIHDEAIKDGLEATPTFLINGQKATLSTFEDFTKKVEPLLAKSR
jgi:protein-disulfide isomerase